MALNPRTQRRLDRIKAEVDILALLEGFGFQVRGDMDREQQFPCKMHGDGQDNIPSARVYPETNSWHCWGCQKSRDAIGTVTEANNLSFTDAIKWLEEKFSLPHMGFLDGDAVERQKKAGEIVADALRKDKTLEDDAKVLSGILDMVTEEHILPLARTTAYWDAFDRILYLVNGKGQSLPEHKGRIAVDRIRVRVMAEIAGV